MYSGVQGTDFFSGEGYPKTEFPEGWKGESGLYSVGFTRRGLSGLSLDAVKVAGDIATAYHQDNKTTPSSPSTVCSSVAQQLVPSQAQT